MKKELKELVKYLSDNAEIHVSEEYKKITECIILIDFCDMYNFVSKIKSAFEIQMCEYEIKTVLKDGYIGFDMLEALEELGLYQDEKEELLYELKKWREKQ